MITKYLKNCQKCRKQTPHIIFSESRKRGAKMQCLKCGYINPKHTKFNLLKEIKQEWIIKITFEKLKPVLEKTLFG